MKILLLSTSFLPSKGGAEISLHKLANKLIEKDNSVSICVPYYNYLKLKKHKHKLKYKLISYPPKFWYLFHNFNFFFRIISFLFFIKIKIFNSHDVIHCTNGYPLGLTIIKLSKYLKFKYLIRCTGEDIQVLPSIKYGVRLNKKLTMK